MLPSIEEVSYGFGSMLVSTMDARDLSRKQLAKHVNMIGKQAQEAYEQEKAAHAAQRQQAAEEVARLQAAMESAEELKSVDARTVREWEDEARKITPHQLDAVVKALNAIHPLDADLEEELRARAAQMNTAMENGTIDEYKATSDRFSDFLKDLMDSDEYGISRVQLARTIAKMGEVDPKAYDEAKAKLAAMPENLPEKQLSITLRDKEGSTAMRAIVLQPGDITAEHIHLIESGALPSEALYETLKKALSASVEVSAGEANDLDRTYKMKQQEVQDISQGIEPTYTAAPQVKASDELTQTVAANTNGVYIGNGKPDLTVIDPTEPASTQPAVGVNGNGTGHNGLAARLKLKPEPYSARKPVLDMNDPLTRYTDAYARVFKEVGEEPHVSERGKQLSEKRSEIAGSLLKGDAPIAQHDAVGQQLIRKLARHMRPLTYEGIEAEVIDAVPNVAVREKLQRLSEASLALKDHLFDHSREGIDAKIALDDLKAWLKRHNINDDSQIKKLNNGYTLEEILLPEQLKQQDIGDVVEHMSKRLMAEHPSVAEESGGHVPNELIRFKQTASALSESYKKMNDRFLVTLPELGKSAALGVSTAEAS